MTPNERFIYDVKYEATRLRDDIVRRIRRILFVFGGDFAFDKPPVVHILEEDGRSGRVPVAVSVEGVLTDSEGTVCVVPVAELGSSQGNGFPIDEVLFDSLVELFSNLNKVVEEMGVVMEDPDQ